MWIMGCCHQAQLVAKQFANEIMLVDFMLGQMKGYRDYMESHQAQYQWDWKIALVDVVQFLQG